MTNTTQPKTAPVSQNDGCKVEEYISPCGSHGDHIAVLELIEGVWLSAGSWWRQAHDKLKVDYRTFSEIKGDLEKVGCVFQDGELYSAILTQIPVPHSWTRPQEVVQ